jgi:hypothetical protein
MYTAFDKTNILTYAVPAGVVLTTAIFSSSENRASNSLLALGLSAGAVYMLNRSSDLGIMNFLNERRTSGDSYTYSASGTALDDMTITAGGIADSHPVLPLPVENVSVPNVVNLPDEKVLLIPAPSRIEDFNSAPSGTLPAHYSGNQISSSTPTREQIIAGTATETVANAIANAVSAGAPSNPPPQPFRSNTFNATM